MLFKNSVSTSKRTPHFTITTINWLTLFKEIISFTPTRRIIQNPQKQNATLQVVKAAGVYSYHLGLKS
jgi:hypothetical protein